MIAKAKIRKNVISKLSFSFFSYKIYFSNLLSRILQNVLFLSILLTKSNMKYIPTICL